MKRIFVDFFWKNSYWGIPEEEVREMSSPGYMKKYGKGFDIDAMDQVLFQTQACEPPLLPVLPLVAFQVCLAFFLQS